MWKKNNGKTTIALLAIASLDHILITPSLEFRLIDAFDWHINTTEPTLYDDSEKYKDDDLVKFSVDDKHRIMTQRLSH